MDEKKKVYVIAKDSDLKSDEFLQLENMVNSEDDKDGEVVGVKDNSIELIPVSEKNWTEVEGETDKILILGNVKGTDYEKSKVTYVFEKYGVKYGWSGPKYAFIEINDKAVRNQSVYMDFLSEFSFLPVCNEELKAGWKEGLHEGGMPVKKGGLKPVQTFIVPFGFVKTIKDSFDDKEIVKKQLYTYGIIMFYYNHMQEFLDL